MGELIDLRPDGFSYAGKFTEGSTHRFYDIFNAGLLGHVGDTILWTTPTGDAKGEVTDTGWENRPLPTRWVDVRVTR